LGGRKGIRPVKMGGWWSWALISPDGVAPSRVIGVSASINLSLHHKVQKFSSGTGSPEWSQKKGRKTVEVWWWWWYGGGGVWRAGVKAAPITQKHYINGLFAWLHA